MVEKTDFELRLADISAAAERIRGGVRRTPVLKLDCMKDLPAGLPRVQELWLKLELMQVTGSFKARGAINKLRSLSAAEVGRGIVTASSGNHGLAVAYAGHVAQVPTVIFLPEPVPPAKVDKLYRWGARIERVGQVWDDSNDAALAHAEKSGMTYIHPFADATVVAGQGTLGLELLEEVPQLDTLLISIGGGGLIGGVAAACKALSKNIRVIGVEPTGAPTLYESVRAGKVIRLDAINTLAGTLAPRQSAALNLSLVQRHVDDIVLVSDEEMRAAARWLWFEAGVAAELSGAAAMAALHCGRYRAAEGERIGVVVCGAGSDGIP